MHMPIADADRFLERANLRIEQYRRHIRRMGREGRETEGAKLVLRRLKSAVSRLQMEREPCIVVTIRL